MTTPTLPEGITPLDLGDELHRRQLTDPTFDPIETARDSVRRACALLVDATAYLDGEPNRTRLMQLLASLVDDVPAGDRRLLVILDTLSAWIEGSLEDATGVTADGTPV